MARPSSFACPGRDLPPAGRVEPPWIRRVRKSYTAQGIPIPPHWGQNYGACSVCGKAVAITVKGTIRGHVNSGTTVEQMNERRARADRRDAGAKDRMINDLLNIRKGLSS